MGVTKTGPYSWRVSTDEKHIIHVDSHLISSEWEKSAAYAGQKAYFLIYTSFVGQDSPMTITCRTESGKTIGSFEHKMRHNYAREAFDIPPDMDKREKIYFDVEAPKLSISGTSGPIPVLPMPYVRDLKWSQDKAERGDDITLSAKVLNVEKKTPAIITIYNYDRHGQTALDKITEIRTEVVDDKVEVLWQYRYHGDTHAIPSKKQVVQMGSEWEPPQYVFTVTIGSTEYGREHESGFLEIFVEHGVYARVLEIEDALFRHGSAVFLPERAHRAESGSKEQEAVAGLAVINTLLRFAEANKEKKLLLAGHTDTTGDDAVNFAISKERAQSAQYLIENKKELWADLCDRRHKDEDIQHILHFAGYDPGPVDGHLGPNTKEAIRAFQRDTGLKDDGVVGLKTWGAFFDKYQVALTNLMGDEAGKKALAGRTSLNWAYCDAKAVGCGELFPKAHPGMDGLKSQTNRRVEALFFDVEEVPDKVCRDGACSKESCIIYKERLFKRDYIDTDKIKQLFKITMLDYDGKPLANEPYVLETDRETISGQSTTADGLIEVHISPATTRGRLTIPATGEEIRLSFGTLKRVDTTAGVQSRLNNLGYMCGKVDNTEGPLTKAAAKDYRMEKIPDSELEEERLLDDELRSKLKEDHGS